MLGATAGLVATLVAPILGDVAAGPSVVEPVASTDPDTVVETTIAPPEQPSGTLAPTTEPVAPATSEADGSTTEPPVTTEPPSPDVPPDAPPPSTAVTSSEPTTSLPAVESTSTTEAPPVTSATAGAIGPTGVDDTYAVTVDAVCDAGFHPAIHIVSASTAAIRVSVGPQQNELAPGAEWHLEWPTLDGDPPERDPTPKWDAVRLDGIEPAVFDEGILSLPAACPPTDVPSAPRDMSSTAGDSSVSLTWAEPEFDGGSTITDYTVEHNAVPFDDDVWTPFDDGVGTDTAAAVTGLTNGETYLFRVRAVNAVGAGVSAEAKDTPNVAPSAPGSVAVAPTTTRGQLRLTWTAPTTGFDIFLYAIERSLDNVTFDPLTEVGGDATSYLDSGLARPERYYYRVIAHNSAGSSLPSAVASGVPNDVPTAARSLTATATNLSGQIRLSWSVPLSDGGRPLTDYIVQRSANGSTGWTTVNDGVNTRTTYTVAGLSNGVRQYFRVLARNALGDAPASNLANAVPRAVPSAARSLTATATGVSGQVRLAWLVPLSTGGMPITDYVLYRSPNGTSNWTWINDGVGTATAHTVTGLSNGVRYYFRVQPRNAIGYGPSSNVPSAVPANRLTAPRNLSAAPTNRAGQIRLSWLAPLSNGGAAVFDYVVQRSPNGSTGWTTILDGVNLNTSYTVTGLSNGVRYHFRAMARTSLAWSPPSNVVNAIPRTIPTAPRSLAAASNRLSGQVRLTWVAPASNGGAAITDYLIQRSANGSTGWTNLSDGVSAATSHTVTGLTNGVRQYFRVFARNAAGWSPASGVVNAIPRTVPSPPAYFAAQASFEGFDFAWLPPTSTGGSPITNYVIQAWDYDTSTWFDLTPLLNPTWRDAFLPAPGFGCGAFRIAAINAVGRGPYLGPLEVCYFPVAAATLEGRVPGKPITRGALRPA